MQKIPHGRQRAIYDPMPHRPASSNLAAAELSLQRGDYERGRRILEQRIGRGSADFNTLNLYAISLAHGGQFEKAIAVFRRLQAMKRPKTYRVKTDFNLGLAHFYQDLAQVGDMSVAMSMRSTPSLPTVSFTRLPARPFQAAIELWLRLLRGKPGCADIINTYLSFSYLQIGDLDTAIEKTIDALGKHENFYITHYVLGRLFLDLYFLAVEGNDYAFSKATIEFFEIEAYEIHREEAGRFAVRAETFLDIGMQAFLDGKMLNPLAFEIYLGLCQCYLIAGLYEEALDSLDHAESLAPNSLATLECALNYHEQVQSPPETISTIVNQIKSLRRGRNPHDIYHVLPPYFLF